MKQDASQPPDYAHFEQRLLALKQQVLDMMGLTQSSSQPVILDQNSVGRVSRVDAMQGQAMAQAGAQRQLQQLKAIDASLAKIRAGHFGRCEDCDQWIASARLEIDPTASFCIECARRAEA